MTEAVKCVVVGDAAVGKSSMIMVYATNIFPAEYVPTVADNYRANVAFGSTTIALGIWDTAGQEEYNRLRTLSYKDTNIFVVCFSLVDPDSYQNISARWLPELNHYCPDTPKLLVGTKADLKEDEQIMERIKNMGKVAITFEMGMALATAMQAKTYSEVSALKNPEALKGVFNAAIDTHLKHLELQTARVAERPKRRCTLF